MLVLYSFVSYLISSHSIRGATFVLNHHTIYKTLLFLLFFIRFALDKPVPSVHRDIHLGLRSLSAGTFLGLGQNEC